MNDWFMNAIKRDTDFRVKISFFFFFFFIFSLVERGLSTVTL